MTAVGDVVGPGDTVILAIIKPSHRYYRLGSQYSIGKGRPAAATAFNLCSRVQSFAFLNL